MPWHLTFLIWLYLVVSTAQQFLPWRRMWSRCCRITTPNAVGGVELQRGVVSLAKSGDTPIQIHGQFPWERWSLSIINQFVEKIWKVSNHRWSRASNNAYHPFPFSDHKGSSPVLPVESASLVLYPARMMGTYVDINGIRTTQNLGSNLYVLLCNWL